MTQPRRSNHRRGTAATELAILLPLLILLALVGVDFGRFAYAHIALGNAARVGAEVGAARRYDASTAAAWQARIESAIAEEFTAVGGIDPANLAVQIDVADDSYELHRATVTANYSFSTVVAWPAIPRPLVLERVVSIRRFR
jgi:Flp pilus assembly protein TadG